MRRRNEMTTIWQRQAEKEKERQREEIMGAEVDERRLNTLEKEEGYEFIGIMG
jgi:hypothetical protein